MKKLLSMLLVLSMVVCLFAACGSQPAAETSAESAASVSSEETAEASEAEAPAEEAASEAEASSESSEEAGYSPSANVPIAFPLFDEPVKLTYMGEGSPWNMAGDVVWSQALQTIDEMANVEWEQTWLTMSTGTDTFNLTIASGDYPDVISNFYKYYSNGIDDGIDQEIIIDMDEPIHEYMPNYLSIVESDPEILKMASTDDGRIWGVHLISNPVQDSFNGPIARTDLMDKYGIDSMETLDDWENYLTQCLQNEAECARGPLLLQSTGFMSNFTTPSFTISSAFDSGTVDTPWIVIDGQVIYSPMTDGYKDYLNLMADWYQKGLVYQDFASYAPAFGQASMLSTGEITLSDGFYNSFDDTEADATVEGLTVDAMPYPVQNAGDTIHLRNYTYQVRPEYTMIISTACDYVEEVCKYFDYMWTDEGIRLVNYGPEGITWNWGDDGEIEFTDVITNDPDGNTVKSMFTYYGTFNFCTYNDWTRETITLSDKCMNALELWASCGDKNYVLPNVTLSTEEAEIYGSNFSDVNTHAQEMTLKFITGQADIDAEWDSYVASLETMGVQKVIDCYQAAYERYEAR